MTLSALPPGRPSLQASREREPAPFAERLKAVRTILVALLVIAGAWPSVGAGAQSGPSLVVGLGVGGFTSADRPSEMTVTLTSPVLISGRLRVRGGDIAVSRPVEVPAGSEQTYRLTLPPLADGTRLRVEVVDGDGEALVSESITARSPSREEMAVGVMGSDDLVNLLGRVRTTITDRPVAAFPIPPEASGASLDVLDYLVVSRQGSEGVEAALGWARSGGRVVVDSSLDVGAEMGDALGTGVDGVARGRVGAGALLAVDDLDSRSAEEWAAILRPAPLDLSSSSEGMIGDPRSLLQAASEAGDRQVPSIPWLLFAILGFAVLVGPVNFLVLSRLGKRDWAWMTIPALALMAVVGFWVAGRQRIAGTNLTHASFISQEGDIEARSAVLVAAGAAGERQLSFNSSTAVYPEPSLMGTPGTELEIVDDQTVTVDLDQLGFTGIGLFTSDPDVELPRVSVEDDRLTVDNTTGLSFWGWGAMAAGGSTVADSELAPGTADDVAMPRGQGGGEFGFGFIDNLINRRQLWDDPTRNNSLWPLSQLLFTEADENAVYFVGITDDYHPEVSSPGIVGTIPGPTLIMVKADTVISGTAAAATVVDTGFVNWLDWGAQRVISTDELTVHFELPDPSVTAELTDARRFGGAPVEYQAWDWADGEFTPIEVGEPLPQAVVAADGDVYVRLLGANEFGDNPMSPRDLTLEWET